MRVWIRSLCVLSLCGFSLNSSWAATESASVSFDMQTDGLCFENFSPELREVGFLGKWGAEHGVCQGIAGVASAFHRNARFDPDGAKPSESEARSLISGVLGLHREDCGKRKIIPGYSNLNEFCADHRSAFLEAVVGYNTDIALNEILPNVPRLYGGPGWILTPEDRVMAGLALRSIRASLKKGRAPLMLYATHVVMVMAIRYESRSYRQETAVLTVYDSNRSAPREMRIDLGWSGLPDFGESMVWNVTPDRMGIACWM